MKKTTFFFSVFFLAKIISAQEIRVAITPISNVFHNKVDFFHKYDSPKLGISTSFDYLFVSDSQFEFGIGLGYQSSKVLKLVSDIVDYKAVSEKINLVSVSFKSILKLSSIFYFSLDPTMEFRINKDPNQTSDKMSGLGVTSGFGGNFKLNNTFCMNVEPRLWINNIVPFHHADQTFRLSFVGINLALVIGHKTV